MKKIGIVGVGELTEKLVRGLIKGTPEQKFVLSPRSSDRVNALLNHTACSAGKSNQDVVNQADIVIVGVRPDSLQQLAEEVSLRSDQLLISVVAGVKREQLQRLFNHANVARMMLTYAAEINRTTVVLTPENAGIEHYFSCLGEVIMIAEEHNFELATVGMCMNGWFYEFAGQLQNWITEKGMAPEDARRLVLGAMRDCAEYGSYCSDKSLNDIAKSIATPGTFTCQGQTILNAHQAFTPWEKASDAVYNSLNQAEQK